MAVTVPTVTAGTQAGVFEAGTYPEEMASDEGGTLA